jgi:hypothetical protein
LNDRPNLLLDVTAASAIDHLSKAAIVEFHFQVRCARHEPKSPHLCQILHVKAQVNATLARMMSEFTPICFDELRERSEAAGVQQITQFRIAAGVKIHTVACFNGLYQRVISR